MLALDNERRRLPLLSLMVCLYLGIWGLVWVVGVFLCLFVCVCVRIGLKPLCKEVYFYCILSADTVMYVRTST